MPRFEVVHSSRVAVRKSPDATAPVIGARIPGEVVEGELHLNQATGQQWVVLDNVAGFMLIDGRHVGLGTLLAALDSETSSFMSTLQEPPPKPKPAPAQPKPVAAQSTPAAPPLPSASPTWYQVTHKPQIVGRIEPQRAARVCKMLEYGLAVRAWPHADGWVRLENVEARPNSDEPSRASYALVDGRSLGFGALLQPLEGVGIEPTLEPPVVSTVYTLSLEVTVHQSVREAFQAQSAHGGAVELRVWRPARVAANASTASARATALLRVPLRLGTGKAGPPPVLVRNLEADEKVLVCVCVVDESAAVDATSARAESYNGGGANGGADGAGVSADGAGGAAPSEPSEPAVRLVSKWVECTTASDPLVEAESGRQAELRKDVFGHERGACTTPGCACTQYARNDGMHQNSVLAFACVRCGCTNDKHTEIKPKEQSSGQFNKLRRAGGADVPPPAPEPAEPPPPPPPPPLSVDEAEEARAALHSRLLAATFPNEGQWPVLEPIKKLWAVSDLHVEHKENWEWLASLPPLFSEDGLIIAGDMCTKLETLRSALVMIAAQFKHVFYGLGKCVATDHGAMALLAASCLAASHAPAFASRSIAAMSCGCRRPRTLKTR
jgi:hypothetical protein